MIFTKKSFKRQVIDILKNWLDDEIVKCDRCFCLLPRNHAEIVKVDDSVDAETTLSFCTGLGYHYEYYCNRCK